MTASRGAGEQAVGDQLIIAAKLQAPRLRLGSIGRPRLARRMLESLRFPLTIVRAEAGYGKTTALTQLAALVARSHWYGLDASDRDPLLFLRHLIALFEDDERPARSLDILGRTSGAVAEWPRAVDALANELQEKVAGDHLLILDDFHLAESHATQGIVTRLLAHGPQGLHIVIGTRHAPGFERMARRIASGDVLQIGRAELAFARDEVVEVFRVQSETEVEPEFAERLVAQTDGWPIAVHLMAQASATELGDHRPQEREALFDYLANEVFAEQDPELKEFLQGAAVLRQLDAELCDELLGRADSGQLLDELEKASLFVSAQVDGKWRLHPLFREYLSRRLQEEDPAAWKSLNERACEIVGNRGSVVEAIYHALQAGAHSRAADLLEAVAGDLVAAGLYETLGSLARELPVFVLDERAELLRACGDAARLTSRFDEATQSYSRADELFAHRGDSVGESRALEGKALVYLDTVQPALAGPLLLRALELVGEDEGNRPTRARLLHLLAENSANHGDLEQAMRIEREASKLDADTSAHADPRIHLRRGRLAQARALAERELRREDRGLGRGLPRSHRESTAILSWIAALSGEAESARDYADRALTRGREMHAPIIEALALCRMGHGWLTGPDRRPKDALACYAESLSVSERIGVDRFRAEALLGQVVAHGELGEIEPARAAGEEAVEILDVAGDHYLAAVVWLALGGVGVRTGHAEALSWLDRAGEAAARSGDTYGLCLVGLWQAIWALGAEDWPRFDQAIERTLVEAETHGYRYILVGMPFLGASDPELLLRVLTTALKREIQVPIAERFATDLNGGDPRVLAEPAPFRANLLGPFELWAGGRQVSAEDWSRDKALALFQFLALNRGRAVHREQIREMLWSGARPDSSALGLRVALSALNKVVEPDRDVDSTPRLVQRQGSSLRLDSSLLDLDVDDFRRAVDEARTLDAKGEGPERILPVLRRAVATYRGDLLESRPYEEWVKEERWVLRDVYLRSATRAAQLMLEADLTDEAIELGESLISFEPCWEPAYVEQMKAHLAAGNRALALRSYERCAVVLREQLDVDPSPETVAMRDRLLAADS